jgi:hypothetical protein
MFSIVFRSPMRNQASRGRAALDEGEVNRGGELLRLADGAEDVSSILRSARRSLGPRARFKGLQNSSAHALPFMARSRRRT